MLFQYLGERQLANALARSRCRHAPPQVERPRRGDVVVNRIEELWIVAPELLPHPIRQADAFSRQVTVRAHRYVMSSWSTSHCGKNTSHGGAGAACRIRTTVTGNWHEPARIDTSYVL
jgi:hypothetical protein